MKRGLLFFLGTLIVVAFGLFAGSATGEPVPNPTVIGPIPVNVDPGDPSHDYVFLLP